MLKKTRQTARRAFARIGAAAADRAIAGHRRPDTNASGLSVHMLVSSRTWHAGLMAAVSFEHHTGRKWNFHIHEDGSVDERARESIRKVLPDVRLINREESDAKAFDVFRAHPKCFAQRKRHNLFLKFSDFAAFAPGERFIVLDSDVVFFRRPAELLEWTDTGADTCLYNKDTREKYCLPREPIEKSMALGMWPCFNSGLILLPRAAVDWQLAERFIAQFEATAHHPQFFEQTLYALMASAWGRGGALPPSYEISWGYFRHRGAVCRHYVGEFKHDLLYIEAAPLLLASVLRKNR